MERRYGTTDEAVSESWRQGGPATCDRGQVRASRAMRTKFHIWQQFAVEFGRVSVNTGALLGEASRDARIFGGSKTITEWWNI